MYEGLIVHYHVSKGKEGCGRLAAAGYKDTGMPAIARLPLPKPLYIKHPRSAPSSEGAERGAFGGSRTRRRAALRELRLLSLVVLRPVYIPHVARSSDLTVEGEASL